MQYFTKTAHTNLRRPARSTRQMRATARARGFTLLELMVSLTMGAIAVTTVYTLGAASSEQFMSQQRISSLQSALRNAMNQIKRDVERAGYHATARSNLEGETCTITATMQNVNLNPIVPLSHTDASTDSTDLALIDLVSGDFAQGDLQADRLTLIGNFSSRDEYYARGLSAPNTVTLSPGKQSYRRSFTNWWEADPDTDANLLGEVFRNNRLLRLRNKDGHKFFVQVTGSGVDLTTGLASVTFGNDALALGSKCVGGMMSGATVAPLSVIRYRLASAPPGAAASRAPEVAGANVQLVREELNPTNPSQLIGPARPLLDYAVSFDVDFVVFSEAQQALVLVDDDSATVNANPERVRFAVVTLSARTPEMDPRFRWLTRTAGDEITRYRFVNQEARGSSRVRTLRAEIAVPSVSYAGM